MNIIRPTSPTPLSAMKNTKSRNPRKLAIMIEMRMAALPVGAQFGPEVRKAIRA
jgi:hypothetical protein